MAQLAVLVPEDYIVFVHKTHDGTILKIPLPPKFSRRDVERLHLFLLSQADDNPALDPVITIKGS